MNGDLIDSRGALLLRIARATLEERLQEWRADDPRRTAAGNDVQRESWLLERAATFVSLHQQNRLRGCVGSLEAVRALAEDVRHNALAAALEDPRFSPVMAAELDALSIEVTVLGPREAIACQSQLDALEQLRPGIDGLVLTFGHRRATFLPQVWESLPKPSLFLDALKEKAGLDPHFWHRSIVLERYLARSWSESPT
jgi:AmmeMemoRadiSam system protein A